MGEGDGELLKRWATLESRVSSLGALVRGGGPAGALLEGVRHLKANLRAVERALPSPAAPELVVLDGEAPPPKRQRGIQSEAQGEVICIDGDEGAASTADCPVCLCPYESHELRVFSCGHWLCHECALRYVSAAVAEGKVGPRLLCPHAEPQACTRPLVPQEVKTCLGQEAESRALYRKYEAFCLDAAVAAAPGRVPHSRL